MKKFILVLSLLFFWLCSCVDVPTLNLYTAKYQIIRISNCRSNPATTFEDPPMSCCWFTIKSPNPDGKVYGDDRELMVRAKCDAFKIGDFVSLVVQDRPQPGKEVKPVVDEGKVIINNNVNISNTGSCLMCGWDKYVIKQ